ncbi:MAG: glycosyltransferase family 39 protein [Deltaproteobacteria bacterium]|nr:glycosyltransferase family 39 protein [Deltaproteobacteria bacterium]
MKVSGNPISKKDLSIIWPDLLLAGFIFYMAFAYVRISGNRSFSFDEFEILYAGASLIRGKALYADQIEPHFPLFNLFIAHIVALFGFKITTITIARYAILLTNVIALLFVYKIGAILWDKRTGLLAVCLTLSSLIFLNRGIEIRHDVFNMTFNVIGAYYGLRYIKEKRYSILILSGIFLGMALASTQKAIVWNVGIIVGLSLYYLRSMSYKMIWKIHLCYLSTLLVALAMSLLYLVFRYNENIYMFFDYAVIKQLIFYAPYTEEVYPFPYNRLDVFKDLIFQNHLQYALAIGGVFAIIAAWFRSNTQRIVVAVWALTGVFFYVTAKRPFSQTFFPSVPPLAILVSGLLSDTYKDFQDLLIIKKIGIAIPAVFLLFIWPLCLVSSQMTKDPSMMRQMANVSFCLNNLKADEKVLCFTQNQIFFDPVFTINWERGEKPIWEYDADWFEDGMINEQCKVIINDYRTRLLNKEVKEKIKLNYIAAKTGDILVPGFVIGPRKVCIKKVWIAGDYYSPTRSLALDGEEITDNLIHLDQKDYRFHNITDRYVTVVYIFDKARVLKQLPIRE